MKYMLEARLWLLLVLLPGLSAQAGLLAEGTRVIYPAASEGRTLMVANTNPWPVLVQTWVDQGEGRLEHAVAPFVVLPAIFRLDPSAIQHLRIIHTGESLPQDRESLFWLNLYEVPPHDLAADVGADTGEARLTLTFNTQLKVLYRPETLAAPEDLPAQLRFHLERSHGHWCVEAHNPTPWYASLSALSVDGIDGPLVADEVDLLLPPLTRRCYRLRAGQPSAEGGVEFNMIGDAGFSEVYRRNGVAVVSF